MFRQLRFAHVFITLVAGLSLPAHAQQDGMFDGFLEASPEQKQEAATFYDSCTSSSYSNHYDCGCMAKHFLAERVAVGDAVSGSTIEVNILGPDIAECVDPEQTYQTALDICWSSGALLFGGSPTEEYCDCVGNAYVAQVQEDAISGATRKGRDANATDALLACLAN